MKHVVERNVEFHMIASGKDSTVLYLNNSQSRKKCISNFQTTSCEGSMQVVLFVARLLSPYFSGRHF